MNVIIDRVVFSINAVIATIHHTGKKNELASLPFNVINIKFELDQRYKPVQDHVVFIFLYCAHFILA
jgi:hypothetical protein